MRVGRRTPGCPRQTSLCRVWETVSRQPSTHDGGSSWGRSLSGVGVSSRRLCRAHAQTDKIVSPLESVLREQAEARREIVERSAEATADHSPTICIDAFPVTEPLDMDHFLGSI